MRHSGEAAKALGVSGATLRRWSRRFAPFLSPEARGGEEGLHRRYTEADLQVLEMVKGLLAQGYTYAQVERRLASLSLERSASEPCSLAVAPAPAGAREPPPPALLALADTLHAVKDAQQMLLGSQQANRDLLGVVIQDNFNLKEENARLRERMLHLERELAELRRVEAARREELEKRLSALEDLVRFQTLERAEGEEEERPGCLGRLLPW
ncbi:MAG: MerR family transcriptional regulator [Anaerolineae bacterium]